VSAPWPDFTVVPTQLIRAKLSPLALRLVLALAKHANAQRMAWPGHERLLKLLPTGTTESGLIRAKREAQRAGWLDYQAGAGVMGRGGRTCLYTLMIPEEAGERGDETVTPDETVTLTGRASLSKKRLFLLTEEAKSKANTPSPSTFHVFWIKYPRKIGRQAAERAWNRLNPSPALVTQILEAIEAQSRSKQWKEGVILGPAKWLTESRWEDEPEAASPLSKQGQETLENARAWLHME
jgi:hypothetical protein